MNILFVCTGNTCRSSMAEALLRDITEKDQHKYKNISVSSAGIAALPGEKASTNAIKVMDKMGINLNNHRARALTDEMLKRADLILTMTELHKRSILMADPSVWQKVHTLTDYAQLVSVDDINDPYGGLEEHYESCAVKLQEAIVRILVRLID